MEIRTGTSLEPRRNPPTLIYLQGEIRQTQISRRKDLKRWAFHFLYTPGSVPFLSSQGPTPSGMPQCPVSLCTCSFKKLHYSGFPRGTEQKDCKRIERGFIRLAYRPWSSSSMAASHWRGQESRSGSIHKAGGLCSPSLSTKAWRILHGCRSAVYVGIPKILALISVSNVTATRWMGCPFRVRASRQRAGSFLHVLLSGLLYLRRCPSPFEWVFPIQMT